MSENRVLNNPCITAVHRLAHVVLYSVVNAGDQALGHIVTYLTTDWSLTSLGVMSETTINTCSNNKVLRLQDVDFKSVAGLLVAYGLALEKIEAENNIPGSYWGDDEAGLIENRLLARADTPLHSILHETCHYVCMDHTRREGVHTDAGGDYDEENAVCYLQILLADHIDGFGRQRMLDDMDRWGYTFRLGSAQAWFEKDAEDALAWLQQHSLIDSKRRPTWSLRKE